MLSALVSCWLSSVEESFVFQPAFCIVCSTLFHTTSAAYDDHWQAAPQRQNDGVNGKHDIGLLCKAVDAERRMGQGRGTYIVSNILFQFVGFLTTLKDYIEEVVLQHQLYKA